MTVAGEHSQLKAFSDAVNLPLARLIIAPLTDGSNRSTVASKHCVSDGQMRYRYG
jgi:hypothetical protein